MRDGQHDGNGEAPSEEDIDRAAILARRRRFILMALGGLGGVGCHEVAPSPIPPEHLDALESYRGAAEPARTPKLEPAPRSISDEQLRAILDDPDQYQCADNHPGPAAGLELDGEQRVEVSKALYERARHAQAEGDLACAVTLLEQAYFLAPGKHSLALDVGEAALAAGDCLKAWTYLEHFLEYADEAAYPELVERAKRRLETSEMQACERPPPPPPEPAAEPSVCLSPMPPPKPPPPPPETKREKRKRERAERKAKREQERAAKIFKSRK